MARFCSKCGRELQEGMRFCPGCGAAVVGMSPDNMPGGMGSMSNQPGGMPGGMGSMPNFAGGSAGTAAAQKNKYLLPLIVLGVVAVAAAVFVMIKVFAGGPGYMKPLRYLEKGLNKRDVQLIQKAFADGGDISPEIFNIFEVAGGLIDYDVVFDVTDKERISKDEIEEVLTEEYYVDEIYARNASAAYILDVDMTIEMGEYSESESGEIPVVRINGKWVIPESLDSIF